MGIPRLRGPALVQTVALAATPRQLLTAGERKGKTFTLNIVRDVPWVLTSNPEDVKAILALRPEDFRSGLSVLRPLTGPNSLLVLSGDEHKRQRRLIMPAFHGDRIAEYPKIIEEATLRQLERMPIGEEFSIRPYLGEITLDVILRAVIGADGDEADALRGPLADWFSYLERPSTMVVPTIFGHKNVLARRVRDREQAPLDKALYDLIDRRFLSSSTGPDVLSMLLESELTREELRDELVTLILAGQETTATALAWAMERLTRHPAEMEQLHNREDYAPLVVKETLRSRSVGPAVTRKLGRDLELEDGVVPAGWKVGLNLHAIHHDPEVYLTPERFIPRRFEIAPPPAHAWLPFGGGARRCVGVNFAQMEMAVVLRTLFDNATFGESIDKPERLVRRFITIAPSEGGKVTRMS